MTVQAQSAPSSAEATAGRPTQRIVEPGISEILAGPRAGQFVCQVRHPGRANALKRYRRNLADARRARRELLGEVARGEVSSSGRTTLARFTEEWFANGVDTAGWKTRTQVSYRSVLKCHILPALGGKRLDKITPSDVAAMISAMRRRSGAGAKTRREAHNILNGIFSLAVERDLLAANPCAKVKRPRYQSPEHEFLSPEEFAGLMVHLDAHWRPLVLCQLETVARISELLAVEWRDVIWTGKPGSSPPAELRLLRGNDGTMKSEKHQRTVRCTAGLRWALGEQWRLSMAVRGRKPRAGAAVFLTPEGGAVNPDRFRPQVFKPALAEAGVELRPRVHGTNLLRHTAASWMYLEFGVLEAVKLTGHTDESTVLKYYTHLAPEARQESTDGLSEAFFGVFQREAAHHQEAPA